MSQQKQDKLITLVTNILGRLYEEGSVSASYILQEYDRVFNKTSSEETQNELIEYFVGIMQNNSLLIYNEQEKIFYYRPVKM